MIGKKVRSLIMMTIVATTLSMGFVGCTKNENKNAGTTVDSNYTEAGTYPVVKEPINISIFAPLRPGITSYDYDKNSFTKYLTDTTGVKFEWATSTESDRDTKRNAMLTSGTYPDVFLGCFFTSAEVALYGGQGIFIPLNDLIDQYAPNIKRVLDENPTIKDAITSPDGNIYTLSSVGKSYHTFAQNKMWINKAWLDKLGLEMPTTTDEFYNVLKAFKEQDPNGNGIADEIPLSGSTNGWNANPQLFLMNAFVPYLNGNAKTMFVKDGTIHKVQQEDGYKDGLKYLNKLYEEQLLDNLTYSQNNDQLKKIVNNPEVALVGCFGGGSPSTALDMAADRWHDYVAVPALKGPNGEQNIGYFPDYGQNVLQITDKCKDPEAVIRTWDLFFTEDLKTSIWSTNGELGIDYKEAAASDINVEGKPATYEYITKADERDGRTWNQLGPYVYPKNWVTLWKASPDDAETLLYNETKNKYLPYKPADENILPAFVLNESDSREIVDIEQPMNKLIDEKATQFIMGTANIDEEWDSFQNELEKVGIKTFVEIYQNAYNEKNK